MTIEEIKNLSYTDFVGLVNQWNVVPGAYDTINRWALFGRVNEDSKILELACTTGFSSRELALLTRCSAAGIDLSAASIEKAQSNHKLYAPKTDLNYFAEDAYKYQPQGSFSHLVIGAALRFFPDPKKLLEKYIPFLDDTAYILSAEFYVDKTIPQELLEKAHSVFNIYPTNISYKAVMEVYQGLELFYEHRTRPIPETEKELEYYCSSTIDRTVAHNPELNTPEIRKVMFDRLFEIKEMSNLLRPYQSYSVLVHRYRKQIYPSRFVELF